MSRSRASSATFVLLEFATCGCLGKVMAYNLSNGPVGDPMGVALGHGAPRPLILGGRGLTMVACILLLLNDTNRF